MGTRHTEIGRHLRDLLGIILGSALNAAATTFFITGCGLVPGGVAGVATLLNRLLGFPLGGAFFIISGLIVVAGLFLLGRESFAKTIFCIAVFSLFLELGDRLMPAFQGNLWLSAILGGALVGLGLGAILRSRGSLGTTDLIGQILNKYFGLSVSITILVMDAIPMVVGAFFFGAATLPHALACLVMISLAVGALQPKKARRA